MSVAWLAKNCRVLSTWGWFHRHFPSKFFVQKIFLCLELALNKLSYKKCVRKMLMKVTTEVDFANILCAAFMHVDPKGTQNTDDLTVFLHFCDLCAKKLHIKCRLNFHQIESESFLQCPDRLKLQSRSGPNLWQRQSCCRRCHLSCWNLEDELEHLKWTEYYKSISSKFYVHIFCTKVRSKPNSKQKKAAQKTFVPKTHA